MRVHRPKAIGQTMVGEPEVQEKPEPTYDPWDIGKKVDTLSNQPMKSLPALLKDHRDKKEIITHDLSLAARIGLGTGAIVTQRSDKGYFRVDPNNWGVVIEMSSTFEAGSDTFRPVRIRWFTGALQRVKVEDVYVIHSAIPHDELCKRVEYVVADNRH